MPLTKEQVQTIFQLVKEHILYYDLQVEMVDHLASNVEEKLEANPSLPFEQALQTAYAGFGSSGFKLLIRTRKASLMRQKWHRCFQLLKEYFVSYKFYYGLRVFAIVYFLSIALASYNYFMVMLAIMMFYGVRNLVAEYYIGKELKYKLLISKTFRASVIGGVVLPQLLFVIFAFVSNHTGFSLLVTSLVILYGVITQVNKENIEKAKELYPEAFVKA